MPRQRASIFDEPPGLDVSGFAPKPESNNDAPTKARVKAVTESKNFKSREATAPVPAPVLDAEPKTNAQRRVLRTGRNAQLNIKTSQAVIDDFYAITNEREGWVLGYTFERAVAALKRELAAGSSGNANSATDADQQSKSAGQGARSTPRV